MFLLLIINSLIPQFTLHTCLRATAILAGMEYLVITAQASQEIDIWQKITKIAGDAGCHIANTQGHKVAAENALTALISGNWNTIAKFETAINNAASDGKLLVTMQRSKPIADQMHLLPYSVQVISLDKPGILHQLCEFFGEHETTVEKLQFDSYPSNATNAQMFLLNASLGVPSLTNIGELREEFMVFCDELNIDGIIEPEKR